MTELVSNPAVYADIVDQRFRALADRWSGTTLLSIERLWSLYSAVLHVHRAGILGAVVECGTFRGGSIGLVLEAFVGLGDTNREVYLFDTFDGFPDDVNERLITGDTFTRSDWITENFRADLEASLDRTGYPRERIHVCAGRVEETLPGSAPSAISFLHLDTDYYGATLHQLRCLVPALQSGGVVQIDDYGHFLGCRRAVDEYFAEPGAPAILLSRVDYTGRAGVKP